MENFTPLTATIGGVLIGLSFLISCAELAGIRGSP